MFFSRLTCQPALVRPFLLRGASVPEGILMRTGRGLMADGLLRGHEPHVRHTRGTEREANPSTTWLRWTQRPEIDILCVKHTLAAVAEGCSTQG